MTFELTREEALAVICAIDSAIDEGQASDFAVAFRKRLALSFGLTDDDVWSWWSNRPRT